jgi:disulfide oxidoreductase YuzD
LIDERRLDSSMMFSVRDLEGVLYITINTDHPMHTYLYEMIDADKRTPITDKERLNRARIALQMLLFSWARMEDESIGNGNRAHELRRIREEWGNMTRSFLETLDESR